MQRFLVRRFFVLLITLWVVSIVIFVLGRIAGDPLDILLDDYATAEDKADLERELGLDKHVVVQYLIFITNAVRGDFGTSIRDKRPVSQIILERLPATFELGGAAFLLSMLVGVPLGVLASVRRGSAFDWVARTLALVGQAAPSFWLGIMLIFFFGVKLEWVPVFGRSGPTSVILPAPTLATIVLAGNVRLVRSAMLDVLDSEFVKLARSKGVRETAIVWKHALKNAVIPLLTFSGVSLGFFVTGSLVTETVFAWPGLGRLAFDAVFDLDYPLLQGVVIVFTLMYCLASLMVDVAYAYIDPRIRYG